MPTCLTSADARRWLIETGQFVGLAVLLALLTAWLHPSAPAYQPEAAQEGALTLEQAQSWPGEVRWIDARSLAEYETDHIPGALWLSEDDWETGLVAVFEQWTPDQTLVVYCGATECHASQAVAARLRRDLPGAEIYWLEGGWDAWRASE